MCEADEITPLWRNYPLWRYIFERWTTFCSMCGNLSGIIQYSCIGNPWLTLSFLTSSSESDSLELELELEDDDEEEEELDSLFFLPVFLFVFFFFLFFFFWLFWEESCGMVWSVLVAGGRVRVELLTSLPASPGGTHFHQKAFYWRYCTVPTKTITYVGLTKINSLKCIFILSFWVNSQ